MLVLLFHCLSAEALVANFESDELDFGVLGSAFSSDRFFAQIKESSGLKVGVVIDGVTEIKIFRRGRL